MGDRRASFPFRIWTSTRTSTNRRQSAPPIVSASSPLRTSEISTTLQPATEPSIPAATTADAENQEPDLLPTSIDPTTQDSSELKLPIEPNLTETSASSEAEPQNLKPSGAVTQSSSQLLPPSPSWQPIQSKSTAQPSSLSSTPPTSPIHGTNKTRSPPQPSSPYRTSPRTHSSPSLVGSKTPLSPPGVSKPRSLSHTRSPHHKSSPSPKGPTSPSKGPSSTREISNSTGAAFVMNEEEPNLAASRQETVEPPLNTEIEADKVSNSEGLSPNDSSNEDKEMTVTPSKLSELDSGTIPAESPESAAPIQKTGSTNVDEHNSGNNSNSKPEEMKEVKEVEQVSKGASIQDATKELETYSNPEASFENQQIKPNNKGSDSEEMHKEKKETFTEKESLVSSSPNNKPSNTSSQPLIQGVAIDNNKQSFLLHGENAPSSKDIRENISTFVSRMAIGNPESSIHDKPVSVITLAGENRGASMHLGLNSLREGSIHIHRSYKINADESAADTITTDGDGSRKEADTSNAKTLDDKPTEAYVNNNAQSINNSLVFNCSIVERNPGVHMLLISQVPKVPANAEHKAKPIETRTDFSMTSAKKLMYKPTIRRRCYRGFFLEPSDSDNPEKPRHQGCRVGCKERGKDGKIHVFSS